MDGMGCTGEAGQTSKAGQFLRLHHRTYMEDNLYSILCAIRSQCSLVKSGQAHGMKKKGDEVTLQESQAMNMKKKGDEVTI